MGGGGGCNAGSSKEKGKKKQLKAVGEIHEFLQIDRLSPKRKKKKYRMYQKYKAFDGRITRNPLK